MHFSHTGIQISPYPHMYSHSPAPPLTQIMAMCKMFHENVRELSEQYLKEVGRINYVTPTSYLELITAFTTLLAATRAEVRTGMVV